MSLIDYITSLSIGVPVIIGINVFKKLKEPISKSFFYFIILSLIIEILGLFLASKSINNHIIYNINTILNAVFVSYLAFKNRIRYSAFIIVIILIFVLSNLKLNSFFEFNRINYLISYLFQGIISCILLLRSVEVFDKEFYTYFRFWMLSGMLIFSFSTISIFLLFDYIVKNDTPEISTYYVTYNLFINLIVNAIYTKAFLCLKKNSTY